MCRTSCDEVGIECRVTPVVVSTKATVWKGRFAADGVQIVAIGQLEDLVTKSPAHLSSGVVETARMASLPRLPMRSPSCGACCGELSRRSRACFEDRG